MPVADFVEIVRRLGWENISANGAERIFEVYGDDWFKDYGESPYELCTVNEARKELLSVPFKVENKEE
jgi:hypothetical protein